MSPPVKDMKDPIELVFCRAKVVGTGKFFVIVCHCLSLFELIFCRAKIVGAGVIVCSLVMLSFQMSVINISYGRIVREKQHVELEDHLIASMYSL